MSTHFCLFRMPLDWQQCGNPTFFIDENKTKCLPLLSGSSAASVRQAAWYSSQYARMPRHACPTGFATCRPESVLCATEWPENAAHTLKTEHVGSSSVHNRVVIPGTSTTAADEPPAAAPVQGADAKPSSRAAGEDPGKYVDLDSRILASFYEGWDDSRLPSSSSRNSGGPAAAAHQQRPNTSVPGLFLGDLFVNAASRCAPDAPSSRWQPDSLHSYAAPRMLACPSLSGVPLSRRPIPVRCWFGVDLWRPFIHFTEGTATTRTCRRCGGLPVQGGGSVEPAPACEQPPRRTGGGGRRHACVRRRDRPLRCSDAAGPPRFGCAAGRRPHLRWGPGLAAPDPALLDLTMSAAASCRRSSHCNYCWSLPMLGAGVLQDASS